MLKKTKYIPINNMVDELSLGIYIEKISLKDLPNVGEAEQSHRHNCHSFFLLEKGTISIEIDFQAYEINEFSVIYVHPNQVHRTISFENVTVSCLAINNENMKPEYLKLLEDITPLKPLSLKKEAFSIISESVSLCIKLSERKQEKLYSSLLKDSCNTLVALITSQYLEQSKSAEILSRFEIITKSFKAILELNFTRAKKPTEYAQILYISTNYLNECVKNTTGYSVSYHIHQRVILEAKRLLYHSSKSLREISSELGYDDYPYFSRLFSKVVGISPLTFRNENHY